MELINLATPECDQSFPSIGKTCPKISDRVMVPSISEITNLESQSQRYTVAFNVCFPRNSVFTEKVMEFAPCCNPINSICFEVGLKLLRKNSCFFGGMSALPPRFFGVDLDNSLFTLSLNTR